MDRALLQDLQGSVDQSVLCWLATAASDGTPNVSPKECWALVDEHTIAIADIASAGSVRNLLANPWACVSFVDVFSQKGFKVIGQANVITPNDSDFKPVGRALLAMVGDRFTIRNIIAVHIDLIIRILAPSYIFHKASKQQMQDEAYRTYRVMPMA